MTLKSASTMTTPTPTSNPLSSAAPLDLIAHLPDTDSLTRLANEFFAALPGKLPGESSPTNTTLASVVLPNSGMPNLDGIPTTPPQVLGSPVPKAAPNATTPDDLPVNAVTAVPAVGGRASSDAFGIPEAYAAALPDAGIAAAFPSAFSIVPVPSTPYYFLSEASAAPSARDLALLSEDRITAHPFGLPGTQDLRALLDTIEHVPPAGPPQSTQYPAVPSGTSFYFLDLVSAAAVPSAAASAHPPFDVYAVRHDFPILAERVNGRQLIWFDNAATTQKPQAVIDRLAYFYAHENSNIHRAAHELAARATDAYEAARSKVARFLGASSPEEIIFVRGATEAINLVAQTWNTTLI